MSNLTTTHLVYSLDGLPLSPMGLSSASIDHLHHLGITTLEQLAIISLMMIASERNMLCDLLQQDLRGRLYPAIVHCYVLLADRDHDQPQFVIESELFHFVASVVLVEENKYTCTYRWLQAEFEGNIPFHQLKRMNDQRKLKSACEDSFRLQVSSGTKQPSLDTTPALNPKTATSHNSGIKKEDVERGTRGNDSATFGVQQPSSLDADPLNFSPATAALPIIHLNLSNRTNNMLRRGKIYTIGQLAARSDEELLKLKNFGTTSLHEIRQVLQHVPQETQSMLPTLQEHQQPMLPILQERQQLITDFPVLADKLLEIQDFPLQLLNYSARTSNALFRADIYTLGSLLRLDKSDICAIRNLGEKAIDEIETVLQSIDIAEVQQTMMQLRAQGRTPANLPLRCLGLSNSVLYEKLREHDIEHLEHLCCYTVAELQSWNIQLTKIANIEAMLRVYGLTLRQDPHITNAVSHQTYETSTSTYTLVSEEQEVLAAEKAITYHEKISQTQSISVADAIHDMLSQVELRSAEVLRLRYGLENQSTHTLEEVGQQLGITRERVRQIEKKVLNKLQHPHRRRTIEPIIFALDQALRTANGVISLQRAQETLCLQIDGNTSISDGQVTFVLLFAHQINVIKGLPMIALNGEPYTAYISAIPSICAGLKRTISNAFAPLSLAEVLTKFASDKDGELLGLHIPEDFVVACLKAHPDIVADENDTYGLKQWANKRLDDIIIVMRQQGKPMHFTEIAAQINRRLPENQQTTPHNVHAHIGRLPYLFVRVGRGLFGLAEWGLVQESNSTDTAYRILCETGHALDIEVLTDRVLETWHVQRTSVRAGIDLDPRFVKVSRGRYWLAETASSDLINMPTDDFDTLFGDLLLRRREELEQDRVTNSDHDALEDARRLGTSIFD